MDLRGRAIHHLSFGEQKRVAMAGVLAMKPSVLILDEPTAGLDPAGEDMMMRLLNQLNRQSGIISSLLPTWWIRYPFLPTAYMCSTGDAFCARDRRKRYSAITTC